MIYALGEIKYVVILRQITDDPIISSGRKLARSANADLATIYRKKRTMKKARSAEAERAR